MDEEIIKIKRDINRLDAWVVKTIIGIIIGLAFIFTILVLLF